MLVNIGWTMVCTQAMQRLSNGSHVSPRVKGFQTHHAVVEHWPWIRLDQLAGNTHGGVLEPVHLPHDRKEKMKSQHWSRLSTICPEDIATSPHLVHCEGTARLGRSD